MKTKILKIIELTSRFFKTDLDYVIKGSFWWVFGRVFGFFASFLILFFFSRLASKEVYGAYQYIISLCAIFSILTLPGLDTALVRAIAQKKEKTFFLCEKEKLKFGIVLFFILFSISGYYFFKKNFELGFGFLWAGIFLPLLALFSLYVDVWQGRERFDLQNKYFALHNLLASFIFIFILIIKPTVIFSVFAFYFSFVFATFLFWLKTRKEVNRNSEEDKEVISFGRHLTLIYFPATLSLQLDYVLLWHFAGPKIVAIYTFALRVVERLGELIPFSALALPRISRKDIKEIKENIFEKFLKLFPIAVLIFVFYILVAPFLYKILFPKYQESIFYSRIFAIFLLTSPFWFLNTALVAAQKKKELYIINFSSQGLKILLYIILIPFFGIWGGVISVLSFHFISSFLTLYFFNKIK
jgi:O-antigen/teichoic acid export membrane protein